MAKGFKTESDFQPGLYVLHDEARGPAVICVAPESTDAYVFRFSASELRRIAKALIAAANIKEDMAFVH